jgi:hypothetical protein
VRFSQVEFVAVLACLLREHRVSVVKQDNESDEAMTKRVTDVIEDCDFQMLLRMKHADDITVRCTRI